MSTPAPNIKEFSMGKGRTNRPTDAEDWTRRYLEVTVRMPDTFTEKDLQEAMMRVEYLIDNWLGGPEPQPETPKIPDFDPQLLMNHDWKGKKQTDGYAKGTLAWGWDFSDRFPVEVIRVLEKGPLVIDKYEFKLNETGALVQTIEKKEPKKRKTER